MWKQLTLSYTICWIIFSYYGPKVSCLDPLDCDFETGFCNWDQSSEDELDWTRISGATSTNNSTLDGYDRTGGFYAYIDTSTGDVGKDYRAWLISPGKTNGTYCFSLWYYMYGKHVYTLKVFKSFNGWTRLFQMLGSKGNRWYLTSIDISSTSWFNIIIFGRLNNVDSSNYSIIAIDDISMFPGNCPTECDDPTPIFGSVDSEIFTPGSVARIACTNGYTLKGKSSITCLANGTWSSKPECHPIDCLMPNFANGSIVNMSEGTTFNSSLLLACDMGYRLQGTTYITCQANGNWSKIPTCLLINCGDPIPVSAYANSTNFQYKSQIEITCSPGYIIVGDSSIICQANGTWSNNPVCEPIDCGDPIPVSGFANSTNFQYKSQIEISCSPGYTIVGNSSIICQASGNWSNNPVCEPIDCLTPPVPHGIISGIVKHTTYNQTVRLDCADGYELFGNRLVICQSDGNWSSLPECLIQDSSSKALTILYILGPVAVVILIIIIILIILMRKVCLAKNIKFCFRNITQKGKAELENDFWYVTYLGHEIETQSDRELHRTPDTRHKEYAKNQNKSVKDIFPGNCNGLDTLTTENEYENNDTSQLEYTATDIFDTEYSKEFGSKCNNDIESHYDTMVTFGRTPKNFQSYFQEKNNIYDYVDDINLRKEFGDETQNGIQKDLDQTYDFTNVDTEQIKQNDYTHLMEKLLKSPESKEICGCECVNATAISKIDDRVCNENTVVSEAGSQSIGQSTKL